MAAPSQINEAIVRVGRRLNERGMIAGSDGNISARVNTDRIVITPAGSHKGYLKARDLVTVDLYGRKLEGVGEPSSEMLMHLFIYQRRPDVRACVHAHPVHATAFAVAGQELPRDILPEVAVFVGAIPLTEYAPPGTDAVPRSLEAFVDGHQAFLLRNHGLLTVGRSLDEALNRHETVEHFAEILILARELGKINHLSAEEYQRLSRIGRKFIQSTPEDGS
jgi:L-fuculose-phosphate aldolase